MKVRDLVRKLKQYNENAEVMIDVYDGWDNPSVPINSVYIDCLYDNDGTSTIDKCVYLEADIIK